MLDDEMRRRIDAIAYETVQTPDGRLPLLTPMSEVAGRMAVQAAAHHLESTSGGAGLLLGGVPGTPAAKGSAGQFKSPGITVTVADNSTTSLRAKATDLAGNSSGCSAAVQYVEQSP